MAVIGAGPAGIATAAELARAGLSVLCIDGGAGRHTGGEALSAVGQDVLRHLDLAEGVESLGFRLRTGLRLVGRDGRPEVAIPLRPGWHVARPPFDAFLLGHAIRQGVHHRLGTVSRVEVDERRGVRVAWRGPEGAERSARCDTVVDASGAAALLSRRGIAGPRRILGRTRLVSLRVRLTAPGPLGTETRLFHGDPLHWAWVVPTPEDEADVCVMVPESTWRRAGRHAGRLLGQSPERVHPALGGLLEAARRVSEPEVRETASFQVRPCTGAGWLAVGDAAGAVPPLFGFGLGLGLVQGVQAARAILADRRGEASAFEDYARFAERSLAAADDVVGYFSRYPAFFASRARDEGFPELLSGDFLGEAEPPALRSLRRTLRAPARPELDDGRTREIARRVRARYEGHAAVRAAFLEATEDGALVSLVLDEDAPYDEALHDLEESLYQEFGRDHLAVVTWYGGGEGPTAPELGREHLIFDRRPS